MTSRVDSLNDKKAGKSANSVAGRYTSSRSKETTHAITLIGSFISCAL